MKKYKHLFFDIDRTLWDYDKNAKEALQDMFHKYALKEKNVDFDEFVTVFNYYNELLWTRFRFGLITKALLRDQRFYLTLKKFNIDNYDLAVLLSNDYIEISPNKTNLFPEVAETLDYLKDKYHLHVITNGFNEVQFRKLKNCKLEHYFKKVVTSDNANSQKPQQRIFEYALNSVNAKKTESLMIGDDWELDVMGAKSYGFDQVYFNPHQHEPKGSPTFTINRIGELRNLL